MKVLVTGGTGFIGSHLVEDLVKKGRDIRCLIRESSNRTLPNHLGVEMSSGDLLDKSSLRKSLEGVGRVYHLAGTVFSSHLADYVKTNIEGTRNLIMACQDKGIEKFFYFSSIAAVGPNQIKGKKLVETDQMKPVTPYGKSKYEAEKLVLDAAEKNGFPTVIVRPPVVFGPRAINCRSAILFSQFLSGRAFLIEGGRNVLSLIYVKNLVEAAILIEESMTTPGEVFFASDASLSIKEIGRMIAREAGIHLREIDVSLPLAAIMMSIPKLFEKIIKIPSPIFQDGIVGIASDWDCSSSKLKKKLGFVPSFELRQGIHETIRWFQKEKPSSFKMR